ncbi:MBL fold metallo-hydrolase [Frigidibacter sp. MR17.14]|uniref:MBL fold metallo-hydrolase n=1 Tax=Frigidibacter sp. MR17.14 TaxID=3126509 RepID=UPI003012C3C9
MTAPPAPPTGRIRPGLRRVLAANPSAMTGPGTNSYILGEGEVAVIDPGPADEAHLQALLGALGPGERVTRILVTHAHRDHSALVPRLAAMTGAEVLAFGDALAGRSAAMARLAAAGPLGGGEGVDAGFRPDRSLADGEEIAGDGWSLTALHTPGHFGNHLCFLWGDMAFTGDLVLGWTSSLISPPDGDLGDYLAALGRLQARGATLGLAGHGADIPDLGARIEALAAHRHARDLEIRATLAEAPGTAAEIAGRVYRDIAPSLLPAASRNVLAHLVDLAERGLAAPLDPLAADARFALVTGV